MIFIAFALGLIVSLPVGPIGQMMLSRYLDKGFWHGFSIAIIVTIVDFILCELFLVGTVSLESINPWVMIILQIAGLIFLSYIGVKELLLPLIKNRKQKINFSKLNLDNKEIVNPIKLDKNTLSKNVATVLIYYISNPTYFAFWLGFSALINQKLIVHHDLLHYTIFSVFFAIGALSSQYISILSVKKATNLGLKREILNFISIPVYSGSIIYFFYIIAQNFTQLLA
jgi:threonine/homoserine/homoserine lactone efflux protein